MAGDEELAGALVSGATGHGSTNRGHRGREGMQADSPRSRKRPEDAADAAVAMAGSVKLLGACGLGPRDHEARK